MEDTTPEMRTFLHHFKVCPRYLYFLSLVSKRPGFQVWAWHQETMFSCKYILKSILFLGRSLDIPFNETSEEVKKTVQGRSVDVNPNGDVFQAESGCFTEKFSFLVWFSFYIEMLFLSVYSMPLIISRLQPPRYPEGHSSQWRPALQLPHGQCLAREE